MQKYQQCLNVLRTSIPVMEEDLETQVFCHRILNKLKNMPFPVPKDQKYCQLDSHEQKRIQEKYLDEIAKLGARVARLYGEALMPGRLELAELDLENAINELDENDRSRHHFQFTVQWENDHLQRIGRIETATQKCGIWPQVNKNADNVAVTFAFDALAHIMLFRAYWEAFGSVTPNVQIDEPAVFMKVPTDE